MQLYFGWLMTTERLVINPDLLTKAEWEESAVGRYLIWEDIFGERWCNSEPGVTQNPA